MLIATKLIPRGYDAITFWPFIFVLPDKQSNKPLIEHELVHYREQAWITPIWILRYALSRRFRLEAEVRAYKRQLALDGITQDQAAEMLCRYGLGITLAQAKQLLASP